MRVQTGLERVAAGEVPALHGKRVALLAHPASVTSDYRHAVDVLLAQGADIVRIFGPEHGFGGHAQDMEHVGSSRFYGFGATAPTAFSKFGEHGIEVVSLYGSSIETLTPKASAFEGIDAVVVDLQDVGARYYTFVWTACLVAKAAAALGLRTWVLDRPNPLGGLIREGAAQLPGFESFVGLHPVPVRHALTIGEIVRWVGQLPGEGFADAVEVVAMRGWQRSMDFAETGLAWVFPSPNMPTLETARVYPGACLLEATTLSEGRGTTKPFEQFGHPEVAAPSHQHVLEAVGETFGLAFRACSFAPTFHKHQGAFCNGFFVHAKDPAKVRSYHAYLLALAEILPVLRDRGHEIWRREPYEFVSDRHALDLLTGDAACKTAVEGGVSSTRDWLAVDERRLAVGDDMRAHWLYPDTTHG